MGRSPPGSSIRAILQARTLEWVAMPSLIDFQKIKALMRQLGKFEYQLYQLLDNSIEQMLNVLGVVMVLWLYRKMSLS